VLLDGLEDDVGVTPGPENFLPAAVFTQLKQL
jgi:hypothetical protein